MSQQFRIAVPLETHWGPATCEDVDCTQFLNGWKLILSVESQQDNIAFIRQLKDKAIEVTPGVMHRYQFKEEQSEPLLVTFTFPAGQPCFKASTHKFQNGRPPLWIQASRTGSRQLRPADFKGEMNEVGHRIQQAIERG